MGAFAMAPKNSAEEREFQVAFSGIDDCRKLIAAGKIQRWDVVKWAVTVELALSAAAITFHKPKAETSYCAFFALSLLTSIAAGLLVWHYNRRMTGARKTATHLVKWLHDQGMPYDKIMHYETAKDYAKGWTYDKEKLIIFSGVLALQLHSLFEMGAACFGLMSSSPE
jgi:hypothetical protein